MAQHAGDLKPFNLVFTCEDPVNIMRCRQSYRPDSSMMKTADYTIREANGPDIPEGLLQSHEEGRVVFFCSAGISYPAGLPDFRDLVTNIYQELGATPNSIQNAAIKDKQYDTAIGLLEGDTRGGHEEVRKSLLKILTPSTFRKKSYAIHKSCINLTAFSKSIIIFSFIFKQYHSDKND